MNRRRFLKMLGMNLVVVVAMPFSLKAKASELKTELYKLNRSFNKWISKLKEFGLDSFIEQEISMVTWDETFRGEYNHYVFVYKKYKDINFFDSTFLNCWCVLFYFNGQLQWIKGYNGPLRKSEIKKLWLNEIPRKRWEEFKEAWRLAF